MSDHSIQDNNNSLVYAIVGFIVIVFSSMISIGFKVALDTTIKFIVVRKEKNFSTA